jgi:hypothetical protein
MGSCGCNMYLVPLPPDWRLSIFRNSLTINSNNARRAKLEFVLFARNSTHNALVIHDIFTLLFMSILFDLCIADELIRQITINCAERGLLLLRVRDEARMRISAYETLYESSIAYGIRKALMAEQRKMELESKISDLKTARRDLEAQVENLKETIENRQARALEKRQAEEKAHAEEVCFILQNIGLCSCFHSVCLM